ncbi:hypothetical protein C8R45DRAFT_1068614 [Mycena sanguinolenta]|nr:hypothetical protein C8R45DRAFT_1068614 [Mycena sanguinolenta]
MSSSAAAGTSLVSGIQDLSAFLPIIGTEQCERHVGEALAGNIFYAAATPLSLFGSLGIAKAGIAILCTSFSAELAQMLKNAGFKLEGSAAAMIARVAREKASKNDKAEQYIAGQDFLKLLQDLNLDASKVTPEFNYFQWNLYLCLWTLILASFSITPYICIILQHNTTHLTWTYPLLRITGSAISVIVIQMILQIRIQQIIWQTLSELTPGKISPEANTGQTFSSTFHDIQKIFRASIQQQDNEKGKATSCPDKPWSYSSLLLWFLQILLVIGVGSTAVGYLGCFTVVQQAKSKNAYIWLGSEVALSLIRICIWGTNSNWNKKTGLCLKIQLIDIVPTFTSGLLDFTNNDMDYGNNKEDRPFIVLSDREFLKYITPYIGPLKRFHDPDHHIIIYYTIAGALRNAPHRIRWSTNGRKVLLTTILDLESQSTYMFEHYCTEDGQLETVAYSASLQEIQPKGFMTVKYHARLDMKHRFRKTDHFLEIDQHSRVIADRLRGIGRLTELNFSWALEPLPYTMVLPVTGVPNFANQQSLTDIDVEYLKMQDFARDCRTVFYREQAGHIAEWAGMLLDQRHSKSGKDTLDITEVEVAMEFLLIEESKSFETLLLEKTTLLGMESHPCYELGRWLDVRTAWESRNAQITLRIDKYAHSPTLKRLEPIISSLKLLRPTDLDDENLDLIPQIGSIVDLRTECVWLWELLLNEKQEMEKKIALWKKVGDSLEFGYGLASAIFGAYPMLNNVTRTLLAVMVERQCAIFDLSDFEGEIEPSDLDKIREIPGVQILGLDSELATSHWPINHLSLSIWPGEVDARSWFCFPPYSLAAIDCMKVHYQESSLLVVQTKTKGSFRVNLCCGHLRDITVSWALGPVNGSETFRSQSQSSKDSKFQYNTFAVDFPTAGTHEIRIEFRNAVEPRWSDIGFISLRRIWVSPFCE